MGAGDPTEERSAFTRPGFLVSAGLVAAVLLGGTVYVLNGDDPAPAAAPPVASAPAVSVPAAEPPRPQPAPSLDTTIPTSAPADLTWELAGGVAVPVSATAGPTRRQGPVAAGYAHSPTGALLAALQIGARHLVLPGDDWLEVTRTQVVPSAGREVYIKNRSRVSAEPPEGGYGQVAGFKFVTYTPDLAVVEFATKFSGRTFYSLTNSTMQWVDGDWKLVLQPDGGTSTSESTVTSLRGFVPFSGV